MEAVVKSKVGKRVDLSFLIACALASLSMALVWGAAAYWAFPGSGLWPGLGIFVVCYAVLVMMGRNSDWTVDDF